MCFLNIVFLYIFEDFIHIYNVFWWYSHPHCHLQLLLDLLIYASTSCYHFFLLYNALASVHKSVRLSTGSGSPTRRHTPKGNPYQISTVTTSLAGIRVSCALSHPCWILTCFISCSSGSSNHSCCELRSQMVQSYPEDPVLHHLPWPLAPTVFLPPFWHVLCALVEACDKDVPIMTEHSIFSLCPLINLFSVLVSIHCAMKLFWQDLWLTLIYKNGEIYI